MSLSTRLEIVSEQLRKMKSWILFPLSPSLPSKAAHAKHTLPHCAPDFVSSESQSPFIPIPGKTSEVQSVKGADLTEGSPAPPSGEVTEYR